MPDPVPSDSPPDDRRMTLGDHLEELRRRLLRAMLWWLLGTLLAGVLADDLLAFALRPTLRALQDSGQSPEVIYTSPTDSFAVQFRLVMLLGAFLASPLAAREAWGFVAAGLWGREKRMVSLFAPFGYCLFVGGALFFYYFVQPAALSFLFGTGRPSFLDHEGWRVTHRPDVGQIVSFWLWMSLAMGVVFQLPLVMVALAKLDLVQAETFSKYRRHFILGAAIVAAVVTPTGDAVTLTLFLIPILALFEGGLLVVRATVRKGGRA